MESPLSESQEIELASELLEIGSEQELEQFLGNLFKGVSRAVGGFIKSPIGKALGGVLKNVAKKALPVVGGALGSMVAPGIGTALGSKLGSMAGGLFEVELEAMPAEAAEFEVARRYVNLAASAARHAALARPSERVNPQTVARAAVAAAARGHAPGVYRLMMRTLGGPGMARRPMALRPRPDRLPRLGWAQDGRLPAAALLPRCGREATACPPATALDASRAWGPPRLEATEAPEATGAPRRYGWGYGGPSGPSAWDEPSDEPWAGGDDGLSGDGFQTSGRWVRRGRQIILIGV